MLVLNHQDDWRNIARSLIDRESANFQLTKSADECPLRIESQLNAFVGLVRSGFPGPLG